MPVYEFRCESCGNFEQFRRMSEASQPMLCPTCNGEAKRIYSIAGMMLSSSLKSRISGSTEPRIIHRPENQKSGKQQHYCNANSGRPWMISH